MKKITEKQKSGKKQPRQMRKLQAEKLEEKIAPYIILTGGTRRR